MSSTMATTVKRRVLVVDDDEANRRFAERALRLEGYDVASAANGHEALRVIDAEPPFDLFVVDILMPQMAGDELGRHIRARVAGAKILYFTGYPDRLFAEHSVLPHNEALIEKPATLNGLLEAVSLAIGGRMDALRRSAT